MNTQGSDEELRIALTLLTNFAARQAYLYESGEPLEGNVTDEENKYLRLIKQHTATAVKEAEVKLVNDMWLGGAIISYAEKENWLDELNRT